MTINTKLAWEEISEWFDDDDGGGDGAGAGGGGGDAGALKETGGQDENNVGGECGLFHVQRTILTDPTQYRPLCDRPANSSLALALAGGD